MDTAQFICSSVVDMWVVPSLGLLQVQLLGTFTYTSRQPTPRSGAAGLNGTILTNVL